MKELISMISMNLKRLRKIHQYTQEDVAEKIKVSRQAVAKWESGESAPDINSCKALADLYNVTIDNLINYCEEKTGIAIPPKEKLLKKKKWGCCKTNIVSFIAAHFL